ncbi:hypothetical protein DJ90_5583 [Paenibacillus macerans]|uniref:Uncharacterized protein n=1 Tax=Paenibacillus macerans TaxID=44252 RepID=A0A090XFT3_PAEMA|nr:hypothetical protein DJ90_5583 [Paenibacillus macerans]
MNRNFDVVARHNHFSTFRQVDNTCYVRCTEIELRTVASEERLMTSTFFFRQYVYLSGKLSMRINGSRFSQYLTAFDFFTVNTAKQCADVVARFSGIQQFTEHFNAGNDGLFRFFVDTHDFDFVADFNRTAFYTARSNGTAASDREYVLDRHQERFVDWTFRKRNVLVDNFEHFNDFLSPFAIRILQSFTSGTADDRSVVARELVFVQQVANFHFNQFKQLFVFNHVAFVQEYDDVRNAYVTGQQDVFASLRHWAVSCGYNQDRAVHLSCAGDHVFNIVGVPWAVNVCIVAVRSFILNVCRRDCDTAFAFFRSFVDLVESYGSTAVFFGQYSRDGCSQSCFTMVDVTNRTDINVRFCTFVFSLCHFKQFLLKIWIVMFDRPEDEFFRSASTTNYSPPLFLDTISSAIFLGTSS